MLENYRVILADDNDILRKGLVSIIQQDPAFLVQAEVSDGIALLNLLDQGIMPDLLILDLSMPLMSGIEVLKNIKGRNLSFKVLILTMHKEPDLVCWAFKTGAQGYMLKDEMAKELHIALRTFSEDRIYLSSSMAASMPHECRMKNAALKSIHFSSASHCAKYAV
jgi:two-component system, NarL family, response regulator NreC